MLIGTDDRTVAGPLGDALRIAYVTALITLEQDLGLPLLRADEAARRLTTRLEHGLVEAGYVCRDIHDDREAPDHG